jgi:hypothetical protein
VSSASRAPSTSSMWRRSTSLAGWPNSSSDEVSLDGGHDQHPPTAGPAPDADAALPRRAAHDLRELSGLDAPPARPCWRRRGHPAPLPAPGAHCSWSRSSTGWPDLADS